MDHHIKSLINTSFLYSIANTTTFKSNERDYEKKLNLDTKKYIISRPYISMTSKIDYFMKREEVISYKISENFTKIVEANYGTEFEDWKQMTLSASPQTVTPEPPDLAPSSII